MTARTSMLHVRVDEQLKAEASEKLARVGLTVSDAVRRIERSNRGQVLSAERMQYDGHDVTRIKVVDDEGRVRIYMDDAQSNPDRQRTQPRSDDTPPPRRPDGR